MTDDLVTWLRTQLDEDERIAREAVGPVGSRWKAEGCRVEVDGDTKGHDVFEWTVCFDEGSPSGEQAEHIARHDPARVLAEVDAKRRILDEAASVARFARQDGTPVSTGMLNVAQTMVELIALPYADRPGYRSEWKP